MTKKTYLIDLLDEVLGIGLTYTTEDHRELIACSCGCYGIGPKDNAVYDDDDGVLMFLNEEHKGRFYDAKNLREAFEWDGGF